jgi:hypothetical protein
MMPRDAITLADVREPTIEIVCEPCGRQPLQCRAATPPSKMYRPPNP